MKIRWDNITKAGLINFFSALYFYLPIGTLWYQSKGLSLLQIGSLTSILTFTIFATTVFTGVFADRFGRKKAIVLALVFQLLGEITFLISNNYYLFALCSLFAGLGFSFWSGAFDAFILDTLKERGEENQVQKTVGSISALKGLSTILGSGISSIVIAQLIPSRFILAILMTIGSVATALFLSFFIKEPHQEQSHQVLSPQALLKKSFALVKSNKKLTRLVLLAILTTPFTTALISLYQPYFKNLQVPGVWFGLAYSIGGLLVLIASKYAYVLEKKLNGPVALLVSTLLPGIFFGLMALTSNMWLAIIFFCFNYGSAALQEPLFADYINRHIPSESRATLLSFVGMLSSLYIAVMEPIVGKVADFSVPLSFLFMGLIITIAAISLRVNETHLYTKDNNS